MPLLQQFLDKLTRLKRGVTKYGAAPHKPVLLLAFIDLFDKGILTQNQLYVDADLVGAFLENWGLLVDTPHSADFTQPFYYLQTDQFNGRPFWFLKPKPGCQVNAHISSAKTLAEVVDYGYFAPEVFMLLTDPPGRELVKTVLLDTYFPQKKSAYLRSKQTGEGYVSDLKGYILNEPDLEYKTVRVITDDEQFVRGGLFKKMVPQMYSNSCCITGMRVESVYGHTFIDACHIVPFSLTHNDTISNGIALCPNLHRAFDRGLITIDGGYRVKVSAGVIENAGHPYSLKQFNGAAIRLPADRRYHPAPANLEWHGGNVFKGGSKCNSGCRFRIISIQTSEALYDCSCMECQVQGGNHVTCNSVPCIIENKTTG